MLKRLPILLGVLLLAATPVLAEGPITKREARTLPSGQVQRRVLGQIGDILVQTPGDPKASPTQPLRSVWFQARPHGTDVPGLCQIDTLEVQFEPIGDGGGGGGMRDADTPVRATGFGSHLQYAVLTDLSGAYDSLVGSRSRSGTPDCARPDAKFLARFEAPDLKWASEGYQVFVAATRAASDLGPALTCKPFPSETKDFTCAQVLAAMSPESIWSVGPCKPADATPALPACIGFITGERYLSVDYRRAGGRIEVLRVDFGSSVIIADPRLD